MGQVVLDLCIIIIIIVIIIIVVFFGAWSSKVVTYANFISDLLSIVFAKYTGIN